MSAPMPRDASCGICDRRGPGWTVSTSLEGAGVVLNALVAARYGRILGP
jgi:hypothetical protein